jgi:RNA polymerase sigma-70 factor (ECF subfamily)
MLFPIIFNVAFRMVRDRQLAEDISQEVFTIGYRKYDKFQEQGLGEFRNYLWQVCKNRCLKILGRSKKPLPAELEPAQHAEAGGGSTRLSLTVREICYSVLDEEAYLVLVLYYVEGYSYEEIGEALGRSTTWVFTCVREIKNKLREAMSKEDIPAAWVAEATRAAVARGQA